jgi:hypothetical protein
MSERSERREDRVQDECGETVDPRLEDFTSIADLESDKFNV